MMKELITFDTLPEKASIDGTEYPIGFGYRTMMAIEMEIYSDHNDEQKLLNALNLFYLGNIPQDVTAAVEYMMWFFRTGKEAKKEESGAASGLRKTRRGYCFEQDAPLLYAAFRQQYGIDLRRTKSAELHWWEFLALFEALDENTKLAKVIYWRTCPLKDMSKKQKKYIQKMRSLYALKEPESTMDAKVKLAQRNAKMKEYVRKRMEES